VACRKIIFVRMSINIFVFVQYMQAKILIFLDTNWFLMLSVEKVQMAFKLTSFLMQGNS